MTAPSPTARSLARLRADGWLADKVEQWVPHSNITRDLFGIGDILALRTGRTYDTEYKGFQTTIHLSPELLLVQATSRANVAARIRKIADSPNVATVREAGIRIEVWGWGPKTKKYPDGLRVVDVS